MKKKIVITGGSGRFGSILKKNNTYKNLFFPTKKELNILLEKSINKYVDKIFYLNINHHKNITYFCTH